MSDTSPSPEVPPAGTPQPATPQPATPHPATPQSTPVVSWSAPDYDSGAVPGAMAKAADRLHRAYTSPVRPATASPERLAGVSLWALLLVLGGAVAGLRAMLADFGGTGTGLAGSLMTLTLVGGMVGLGLTIGAFLTIAARRLPWVLLGTATAVLLTLLVLSAIA
jgi:hypothetical protein